MAEELTNPSEVKNRIEDEVTPDMERVIAAKILDASDLARFYGDPNWTDATAPPVVGRIVASAVARFMGNPSGYSQSRAADETIVWSDYVSTGEVSFSDIEIRRLESLAETTRAKFGTFGLTAYGTPRNPAYEIFVPVDGYGKPFPIGY